MSYKTFHRIVDASTSTTDGTTNTTVASFDTTGYDNCSFFVKAKIVGTNTSTRDGVALEVGRSFTKASGTLTANGTGLTTITAPFGVTALTAAVPTLDVSSNTIRVRMVGVTATTIEWAVDAAIIIN